jgi:hypothetical protein
MGGGGSVSGGVRSGWWALRIAERDVEKEDEDYRGAEQGLPPAGAAASAEEEEVAASPSSSECGSRSRSG